MLIIKCFLFFFGGAFVLISPGGQKITYRCVAILLINNDKYIKKNFNTGKVRVGKEEGEREKKTNLPEGKLAEELEIVEHG